LGRPELTKRTALDPKPVLLSAHRLQRNNRLMLIAVSLLPKAEREVDGSSAIVGSIAVPLLLPRSAGKRTAKE
jgi:hypothetical protein